MDTAWHHTLSFISWSSKGAKRKPHSSSFSWTRLNQCSVKFLTILMRRLEEEEEITVMLVLTSTDHSTIINYWQQFIIIIFIISINQGWDWFTLLLKPHNLIYTCFDPIQSKSFFCRIWISENRPVCLQYLNVALWIPRFILHDVQIESSSFTGKYSRVDLPFVKTTILSCMAAHIQPNFQPNFHVNCMQIEKIGHRNFVI